MSEHVAVEKGVPEKETTVWPLEDPVPRETPAPAPEPQVTPERVPELTPA